MIKQISKEEALTLWEMGAVVSISYEWYLNLHDCECFTVPTTQAKRYDEKNPDWDSQAEDGLMYLKVGMVYRPGRCDEHAGVPLPSHWDEFYIVDIPENEEN